VHRALRLQLDRKRDVDPLLAQPLLQLGRADLGLSRLERGVDPAACSFRACGGSAPISRLASAIGERSAACAIRACLSSATVVAAAKAANASATMASTFSALSGATWTGS
jgi:hypothetical protein